MIRVVLLLLACATLARADAPAALHLPRPDRAVLMAVAPGATEGPAVKLSAAKARKVLKLMQRFTWNGLADACDKPQYVIRFYAEDKLLATDGLCFHCGCLAVLDDGDGEAFHFDLENANTKALESYLEKFFPAGK